MWSSQADTAAAAHREGVSPQHDRSSSQASGHNDVVVRVGGLSKCYTIYERPADRLKQSIVPRVQHLFRRVPHQYYREFWALRDVSFEVKRGETFGIIGRNGAGKSTLLGILSGTLHPTTGTVEITGRVAALLELGSGFNPEFSGRENVYVYAGVLGLGRKEIDARLPSILEFADIADFIDMPVKTYSSGMVMRLAFSVIAHIDANILIIDEALAVGDAFFVQKCMRFLRNFMERGTVLFVSHDTGAVNSLCRRVLWLRHGAMNGLGSPKEITEAYLADLHVSQQGPDPVLDRSKGLVEPGKISSDVFYDQRQKYLNRSSLRNDIELFRFNSNGPGFGRRGALIVDVQLNDREGKRLLWCVGGEDVVLRIRCEAQQDLASAIVGFAVRDRLGQDLFGDNTFLSYRHRPFHVRAGERFEASFVFRMPILPVGDYSICVAVADGTQTQHVRHQWIYDALIFKSHSSSVCTGLIGIPMLAIELKKGT